MYTESKLVSDNELGFWKSFFPMRDQNPNQKTA